MAEQTRKKGSFVKQAAILAFAGLLTRFLGFVYRLPLTNLIGDSGNAISVSYTHLTLPTILRV